MPIHPSLKDLYPPDWEKSPSASVSGAHAAAVNGAALSTAGRIPRLAAGQLPLFGWNEGLVPDTGSLSPGAPVPED